MSAWKDFVTAALLGTEKSGGTPTLPAALEPLLGPAAALEREAAFLTRAGALAWWRQTGWKPSRGNAPFPAPASAESAPPVGAASAAHLRAMLGGHCAEVLPEWLGESARRRRALPPELLPALLDRARQTSALRPAVLAAGGARIRWLAEQNPAWNFAADDSSEHWETGSRDQRTASLRRGRASDPAAAREKLAAVWSAENADTRGAFLAVLAEGLSNEDAPFLERALDDRSKEVRQHAAELLARLPGSAFTARMLARAEPLLSFKRGGLLGRASLGVVLPPDPDPAAVRDGLDPKAFGQQKLLGEKAVLLTLILASVPLRHWTDVFQQTPAELLKAAGRNEFADALSTGWALAAHRQRDAAWAEALLDAPVQPFAAFLVNRSLFDLLPTTPRAARLLASLRQGALSGKDDYQAWQTLTSQFQSFEGYLPTDLARELITRLRALSANDQTLSWQLWTAAKGWFLKVPPPLLPEAAAGWPVEKTYAASLASLLAFRHEALAALAQP